MKRDKIKKAVSKKAKKVKGILKTSKKTTTAKSVVERMFQAGEKTVDSDTLIKRAQERVLNSVKNGIEFARFVE